MPVMTSPKWPPSRSPAISRNTRPVADDASVTIPRGAPLTTALGAPIATSGSPSPSRSPTGTTYQPNASSRRVPSMRRITCPSRPDNRYA